MRVVFRADASLEIGSGHVMRCLALADQLRSRGAEVSFVCREHPGHLIVLIEAKGYRVARLPQGEGRPVPRPGDPRHAAWLGTTWERDAADTAAAIAGMGADWLILDHYALDRRWELALRPVVGRIAVIDDLADRPHDCDLLLDQNLSHGMETRYDALLPAGCRKLLGPSYALLRPEFAAARSKLLPRSGEIGRILIFFGGVDPSDETEKALRAVSALAEGGIEVDVVVGGGYLRKERLQELCAAQERFHYHCQVDNMAQLMAAADLAIGAGGTATWERCYLELPCIVVANAENQLATARAVAAAGAALFLGPCGEVSAEDITAALRELLADPGRVREMGRRSGEIMGAAATGEAGSFSELIMGGCHAET